MAYRRKKLRYKKRRFARKKRSFKRRSFTKRRSSRAAWGTRMGKSLVGQGSSYTFTEEYDSTTTSFAIAGAKTFHFQASAFRRFNYVRGCFMWYKISKCEMIYKPQQNPSAWFDYKSTNAPIQCISWISKEGGATSPLPANFNEAMTLPGAKVHSITRGFGRNFVPSAISKIAYESASDGTTTDVLRYTNPWMKCDLANISRIGIGFYTPQVTGTDLTAHTAPSYTIGVRFTFHFKGKRAVAP